MDVIAPPLADVEFPRPSRSRFPATADGYRRVGELTERQREVLDLVCEGLLNKQIAHRLGVAPSTVKAHVRALCKVLGVRSRIAAALFYVRHGG